MLKISGEPRFQQPSDQVRDCKRQKEALVVTSRCPVRAGAPDYRFYGIFQGEPDTEFFRHHALKVTLKRRCVSVHV